WPARSHLTSLVLNRLERRQVETLITQRAGGKALPTEVVQHIVTKTDGVPLYVEELTKVLLASPLLQKEMGQYVLTEPLRTVAIPDTLQGALMARLNSSSRQPRRSRSSRRWWGGSLPMTWSRILPPRTKRPCKPGWGSWWPPHYSLSH